MGLLGMGMGPEDFTGWDDVSSPVYTGMWATTIWKTIWGRTAIELTTSIVDPISKTFSCIKLPFTESVNTFSTQMNRFFGTRSAFTGGINPAGARVLSVWHADNNCKLVCAPNGTVNTFDMYLTTDFYTWSEWVPLNIPFTISSEWANFTVRVTGGGTNTGTVTINYGDGSGGYMENGKTVSWSGDLTEYANFNAVSCHDPFSSSDGAYVTNVAAATEDLSGAFIGCFIPQTAGTISGWYNSGYTTAAGSTPSVVATYSNALYGLTPNTAQTFIAASGFQTSGSTTTTVLSSTYIVKYVIATATAFVPDPTTEASMQPIVYNPTTATTTALNATAKTPTADTTVLRWVSTDNPETTTRWSSADLLRYQFGFERVK